MSISVLEAEEIEGVPVDVLDWTTLTTFVLEDNLVFELATEEN